LLPGCTISTEKIGKQVILTSSYTGLPRSTQQLYQNLMAMVSALGRSSYFVTFICNPYWTKIVHDGSEEEGQSIFNQE
jgi:hypothetical protein